MAVLNEEAIKNVVVAGNIIYKIFCTITKLNLEGMKTIELNNIIDKLIRENNGVPAFLNYRGFPKSVCISLNEEVVHGIPDERVIKEGDLVKIDVGVKYNGYIADAARTFAVGKITEEAARLIRVTKEALKRGIEKAQNGNKISNISRAIQRFVEENGFSVVRELTGHGVGRELHEEPMVPNFLWDGPDAEIKTGMALAIEPMVNMGNYEVVTSANSWTILTRDRSLSCHFEDTIIVLEKGNLNVTRVVES
uniref:Methionine aminopeptidase n=1 Tax=candidate division WOR-3 bacterium TaxID=2052148 RepID=A0A7C4TGX1_UNCW3